MASMLEKYNRQFKRSVKNASKVRESQPQESPLEPYLSALNTKDALEVSFDMADEEGNLSTKDKNGVKVVLSAIDFVKDNPYYNPNIKTRFIGLTVTCRVARVDEENGIVYLKSAQSSEDVKKALMHDIFRALKKNEVKNELAEEAGTLKKAFTDEGSSAELIEKVGDYGNRLRKIDIPAVAEVADSIAESSVGRITKKKVEELCGALDKASEVLSKQPNKYPVLSGDVISVNSKRVIVNILHRNILGILKVNDWSSVYTRSLEREVKTGDVIEFEVIRQAKRVKNKDIAFELSRKNITPDPWKDIEEVPTDSVMVVECVEKPVDKTYFWGKSNRFPGIEIQGDNSYRLKIMVGAFYKCRVRNVDKKKHVFQVTPFEYVNKGIANEKNIKWVTGRS